MQKLYILDASGYIYRSYFAIRNMTNSKGESTNALFGFIRSVLKLFKDFNPVHVVAVFDGPHNAKAREEIYADYKAHRAETPSDLIYQINWSRSFCELMGIPFLSVPEVEADDTMGSVAKWAADRDFQVYLCTSDKDLCQMVNDKISILNTHKENLILGPNEVEQNFGVPPSQMIDLLAMTGDASDNIPGLPGIGPKTAAGLLKEFGSLDYLLKNPEKIPGKKQEIFIKDADKALLSRQLVTIKTDVHFPKDKSFFMLQHPPDISLLKEFYTEMNFNSLIKELDLMKLPGQVEKQPSKQETDVEYVLVDDEKSLHELISYLKVQKEICVDTETTDVLPIKAELVGIGFGVEPKKAWYIPVNGKLGPEKVLKEIKPLLTNPHIGFYGHNIKYDYQVLWNYDIKIANICFDTLVASYLLNSHSRQHSLDQLTLEYFGIIKINIKDLLGKGKQIINMNQVSIEKVCEYCCEDVDYTCRLKKILEKALKERKLESLFYELELPLLQVLARMERQGIYVDVAHLNELSKEINEELRKKEESIYQLAGEEFNINSPKQLSDILFQKLKIHAPQKNGDRTVN